MFRPAAVGRAEPRRVLPRHREVYGLRDQMHAEVEGIPNNDFVNRSFVRAMPDLVGRRTHEELPRGDEDERHADGVAERLGGGARGRGPEYLVEHFTEVGAAGHPPTALAPHLALARLRHVFSPEMLRS